MENIDKHSDKLTELINVYTSTVHKDDQIHFRTSKVFHALAKFLIEERHLSGEAELFERSVLFYAGELQKHKESPLKIMTDAELDIRQPKRMTVQGKDSGHLIYLSVFGTKQQRETIERQRSNAV